jgi:major membrane immunogen (membrane-anchored lipoprotein)
MILSLIDKPGLDDANMRRAMSDKQTAADLETLARIAARLAGRDPDERVEVRAGAAVVFSDVAWRYPDFVARAAAAYDLLDRGTGF